MPSCERRQRRCELFWQPLTVAKSLRTRQPNDERSYLDLLRELGLPVPEAGRGAHLDPDLVEHVVPRLEGWRAMFGQVGASQTHLDNNGVDVGDVFLFFGLFRQTIRTNEGLR